LRWGRLREKPEGWIVTVATNLSIDRHRRRRRLTSLGSEPLAIVDMHQAERIDLARALRRLPRRQREVVVLRYLADWSESDVAVALGISAGAVKSHASRGLAALRQHLDGGHHKGVDDVRASG
jgi:RNA polymerase sigma factor (sigma-70 family)